MREVFFLAFNWYDEWERRNPNCLRSKAEVTVYSDTYKTFAAEPHIWAPQLTCQYVSPRISQQFFFFSILFFNLTNSRSVTSSLYLTCTPDTVCCRFLCASVCSSHDFNEWYETQSLGTSPRSSSLCWISAPLTAEIKYINLSWYSSLLVTLVLGYLS